MEAHKEVRTVTTETICVVMSKGEAQEFMEWMTRTPLRSELDILEGGIADQFYRSLKGTVGQVGRVVK